MTQLPFRRIPNDELGPVSEFVEVGGIYAVHSRGAFREVVAEEVTATRAYIAYTTEGAITAASRLFDFYNTLSPEATARNYAGFAGSNWDFYQSDQSREYEAQDRARGAIKAADETAARREAERLQGREAFVEEEYQKRLASALEQLHSTDVGRAAFVLANAAITHKWVKLSAVHALEEKN